MRATRRSVESRYRDGRVARVDQKLLRRWVLAALALPLVAGLTSSAGAAPQAQPQTAPASLSQVRGALVQSSLRGRPSRGSTSTASAAPTPCGKPTGVLCADLAVPLDRTGAVPGTVSLHVEELPAQGVPRGVVFLIAGGPGQGSAHVYGLGDESAVSLYRFLFPGYTLVAYDDRGTGASGLLDCPALQRASSADAEQAAATACAAQIGPQRDFYSTSVHAEDLESVRQALGFDKIALFGVSYGTKLAMAYALAHPDHVERLLLDSVLPPEQPDPYEANVLRDLPATLSAFCSDGGCRAATSDFAGDVVAVANKLGTKPLRGKVGEANGQTRTVTIGGVDLLSTILGADLSPGLAAELPAVVKAARGGNTQPLLRLSDLQNGSGLEPSIELSDALYAATVCHDGPFPWAPDTPIAARPALEHAAIAALPAGSFGPFGTWAARFGNADFCLNWPSPAGGATLAAGPLPNVPMLAISGGFDMRTPTEGAASVVARFPQGKLLVVPGIGHSTVTADFSACAARAVHSWMTNAPVPTTCARPKALVVPVPALPPPGPANPKHRASPAATFSVATKTIREAEAAWLMTAGLSGSTDRVPALYGGYLVATSAQTFRLVRYSIAHGVAVSGTVKITSAGPPVVFQGSFTISGAGAATGVLGLQHGVLRGALGGRLFG
jgi:pimeloyl-ACP methyl ester carboxylesterase